MQTILFLTSQPAFDFLISGVFRRWVWLSFTQMLIVSLCDCDHNVYTALIV